MNKIIVIVGPTCTGETKLSIELAKKYNLYGLEENKKIAIMGGNTAKIAKDDLENKLGDKVITNNNSQYIDENKSN